MNLNELALTDAQIEYLVEMIAYHEERLQDFADRLADAYRRKEEILVGDDVSSEDNS